MFLNKKFWLWLFAIAVVLLLFITFAVPQLGGYYAKRWMLEQGASTAEIQKIRFNPFTGKLAIENVEATFSEGDPVVIGRLATEIQWRSLWSKFFHLNQVSVERAATPIQVSNEVVRVGQLLVWQAVADTAEPTTDDEASPWQFKLDALQLQDWQLPLNLYAKPAKVHIESFKLTRLDTSQSDTPVHIEFKGRVNGDPVTWGTDVTPFASQPVITGNWQFDQVDLAEFAPFLAGDMQQLRGVLGGDTQLHIEFKDQGIAIEQQGDLQLVEFFLPALFEAGLLDWSGQVDMLLTQDENIGELSLAGDLNAQAVKPEMENMMVDLESMRWSGDLAMSSISDVQTLKVRSGAMASGVSVSDGVNSQKIQQLHLQNLNVAPGMLVNLGSLQAKELVLASGRAVDADLKLKNLLLTEMKYSEEDGVIIQDQQLTDLKLTLGRDEQGQWLMPYMPVASQDKTADEDTAPIAMQLDQIQLMGDSSIHLHDRTVKPAAINVIQIEQLQLQDIATNSETAWSTFTMQLRQGDYGKLAFEGKLRQPGAVMDLDVTGNIEQMELTPWSSYLSSATGYQVKHGVLDSILDIKVEQGVLDANTQLQLHNLEVERADDTRAQQMEAAMSMPLDSALSMLRDGDNNIKLKIPVSGNLQSPEFDISDVMNKAIATALKKTTVTYLKYALQPYGALLMLGEAVGSQAGKVGFTPVEFTAKQTELTQPAIEYMAKLGGILEQRPEMRLTLCGVATPQDLPVERLEALQKQSAEQRLVLDDESKAMMLGIAEQRAARVKQFLVEKYAIEPGRLFTCLPKLEQQPDALPRVDVSL